MAKEQQQQPAMSFASLGEGTYIAVMADGTHAFLAFQVRNDLVTLHLIGGGEVTLSKNESDQFLIGLGVKQPLIEKPGFAFSDLASKFRRPS
jgi:hypothetical protein